MTNPDRFIHSYKLERGAFAVVPQRPESSALRVFVNRARKAIEPCPRPVLTGAQVARVIVHKANTLDRHTDPKRMVTLPYPLFDAEPSQRCDEAVRCG